MRRALPASLLLLVRPPAFADSPLTLQISPPAAARVGARADLGISVQPGRGLALHELAPLFVDVTAPDALGPLRQRLERLDALRPEAPSPAFRLGLRPTAAGTHPISVRVRAYVCRASLCRAVEATRTARVNVSP